MERERRSHHARDVGDDGLERDILASAQLRRQDADDAPVVGAAHGEEQVEPVAPEIDIELARHHRAADPRIRDEEYVLVGRAGELDPAQAAHGAVGAVAAGGPGRPDDLQASVGLPERRRHLRRGLLQGDEFGVPARLHAEGPQVVAQQPFVVVLSEDEEEGIGTEVAPDIAERHARGAAAADPHVGTDRPRAQLEGPLGDAEARVDLERAGLHPQRLGADGGPGIAVDDEDGHAAPRQLIGQHESGRPGADDEDVDVR